MRPSGAGTPSEPLLDLKMAQFDSLFDIWNKTEIRFACRRIPVGGARTAARQLGRPDTSSSGSGA
jgi:hypothetical protein